MVEDSHADLIALEEMLFSADSIGIEGAAGNNFFGCSSMELEGFPELRHLVIGNYCFRYAEKASICDMEQLEKLEMGDDCLILAMLLEMIGLPSLKEWKIRGKCLNYCTQFKAVGMG